MTVHNCFVQGNTAYLLSDTAWCGEDGTVRNIASKVVMGTAFPFAIGITGTLGTKDLADAIEFHNPRTAQALIDQLPVLFREAVKSTERRLNAPMSTGLTVIMWAEEIGEARAMVITSDEHAFGADKAPYTLYWSDGHIPGAAAADHILLRHVNIEDPASFDVRTDGLSIIEAQRRTAYAPGFGGESVYRIGGGAMLTTVSAGGVAAEMLRIWPDVVGQIINPNNEGHR